MMGPAKIALIRSRLRNVEPKSILWAYMERERSGDDGTQVLLLTREDLVELLDKAEEALASRWRQFGFNHIPAPVPGAPSVDEYGWSARICTAFKVNGIVDMEQLCSMSDKNLLQIKNFGRCCLSEVRAVIREYEKHKANIYP